MAAGDVWDYIFGSYVNAARALPYINDGVIVIRRLNARGTGTKPRRLSRPEREKERIDARGSVLRTVTHCEIRPTVTASRTRSIKSDDAETTRLGCVCISRHRWKPNAATRRDRRRHYGTRLWTPGGFVGFEENEAAGL